MHLFHAPKGANGAAGDGFFSALIKSIDVSMDAPEKEIPGIMVFSGNNSTMSAIFYDIVL